MSLTHTSARRNACDKGTRIATLPGITEEMFVRTMGTDWRALSEETRRLAQALGAVSEVRIRTDAGTDLSFETNGQFVGVDDGRYVEKGAFGNLPAGEAFLAPREGTAEGSLVIDGSFPLAGLLDSPLVFEVHEGLVTKVSGHACASELERVFEEHGEKARTVAEFGVGTLGTARISGNVLEDEKVKGTIHVAVGNNASMGGTVTVPVHLDGVVRTPTVWLDGRLWIKEGEVAR
jgi:leucyl aminopeptidase (aminopeptidase T)